jgi:hypothetical protein
MHTNIRRILTALTVTTTAAALTPVAAHAASFGNIFHLHPHPTVVTQDARVSFMIYNNTYAYQEFKVNGVTYVVPSHFNLLVKAPVGTEVYAASKIGDHARGSLLFSVSQQQDAQKIVVE